MLKRCGFTGAFRGPVFGVVARLAAQKGVDLILANREMVRLDDHLDLPAPWPSLEIQPRYPELIAAIRDCEFKSLLKEIEDEAGVSKKDSEPARVQGELF